MADLRLDGVAKRFGAVTAVDALSLEVAIGPARVAVPPLAEAIAEAPLLCGVRPEHVRFDERSSLRGEVVGSEYLGHSQIVTVTTAVGSTLRAKVGPESHAERGDHVGLVFDAAAVSLFDRASGRALQLRRGALGG